MNPNTRKRKFTLEFNTGNYEKARLHLDKLKEVNPDIFVQDKTFMAFVKFFERQEAGN